MSFTRSRRPRQRASNIYIFTKMTFALKMYKINKECEVIDNHAKYSFDQAWFLFRSARTSCTSFGWFVRSSVPSVPSVPQEKCGSLIYRHICLMNHEDTHQTNPMAPWDPLDALSTPWDPLAPPIDPLRPINRSLGLIALLRSPQLPHKSHSPSTPSPMSPRHLCHHRHRFHLETFRP